jgi:hypothetical protein
MRTTEEAPTPPPFTALLRSEWVTFRNRRRVIVMAVAILVTVLLGLLGAFVVGSRSTCSDGPVEAPCPIGPAGPQDQPVSDTFAFAHRPIGETGSVTVRLTDMTGIITYPPPDHDEIVPGLVPWAKAGIIIKDGTEQGSSYAALMLTGDHGVRMQHDYTHDTAGSTGSVSPDAPRWLRLTRDGDTVTGYESTDGARWTTVGVAHLAGLPETARAGMFAASPGDLTFRPVALGGTVLESRFTQSTGTFDHVSLDGAPAGEWSDDTVGEMGHTDWEKYHRSPGLVETDGTFTVTGTGDIGPVGEGHAAERNLVGLVISLIIVIVAAARFMAESRPGTTGSAPLAVRALAAKAAVVGGVAFVVGLVSTAVVLPLGAMILRAKSISVIPVPVLTELRVVVGVATLFAVVAVFALSLVVLLRRAWAAALVAISAVAVPYLLAALPLLPDGVADWLLRVTPAAGFAVEQTIREYPQVLAHYAPSEGYFPLPWWAGLAVLCGYAAVTLALALVRLRGSRRLDGVVPAMGNA